MSVVGALAGYGLLAAFALVAAWPLYSVYRLALRVLKGTPLPAAGIYGLYLGGFPWTFLVFYQGALHPALKPLLVVPFLACGMLAAVWGRFMDPPRSGASSTGDMLALWFFGLMSLVTCGGGYFDRMVTVSEASGRLSKAGIRTDDPAALARAIDAEDPFVRMGAAMNLQRFGASAPPARDALTKALADPDERVADYGRRAFYGSANAVPSPEVLGPLLDSADAASRERAGKGLDRLDPAAKTAALKAVEEWRARKSVYYAHPLSIYDMPEEAADIAALRAAGYRVNDPNDPAVEGRFQASKDFSVFTDLAQGSDAVAVRSFPDGKLGAGVAKEALSALERGKPVFELRDGDPPSLRPLDAAEIRSRALTIEETRAALKRYGVVPRIKY
ncbi:MAG: HEAT repeat domain-containing protein [Elusimicrobia bacterium]|nr:HEAT repeat domain-containing protein [Elusimicrobiota bacterium]